MNFYDYKAVQSLIDVDFLYSQGFYVPDLDATEDSIFELISEIARRDLVPHPLFDRDWMRQEFGSAWLINYINQNNNKLIAPSELVSYDYFASQIYTEVSLHLAVFQYNDVSLCPDFDMGRYLSIVKGKEVKVFSHIFGDYCHRSKYKFISSRRYVELFNI